MFDDGFFSPLIPSASQDGPTWFDAPFLARLTSFVTGTGAQAGLNLYGFIEQNFDPATGLPVDTPGGRQDDLQTNKMCYALEVDNSLVPGLTSTPASAPTFTTPLPSPLPAPYVDMRLRGIVNGSPVYEFQWPGIPPISAASTGASATDPLVAVGSFAEVSGLSLTVTQPGNYLVTANIVGVMSNVTGAATTGSGMEYQITTTTGAALGFPVMGTFIAPGETATRVSTTTLTLLLTVLATQVPVGIAVYARAFGSAGSIRMGIAGSNWPGLCSQLQYTSYH